MTMVIEGLRTAPQPPTVVNMSDHVGATVEGLDIIGLVDDRDRVTETVTTAFSALDESGRTGEAHLRIPRALITLEGLYEVSDSAEYAGGKKYPQTYVYDRLWTPGTDKNGYKADELDNVGRVLAGRFAPHAALAVHNPDSKQEPLLHFLGIPFDEKYADKGELTQLQAVEKAIEAYEAEGHEGFEMSALNAKAIAWIALVRRIKGEDMPLQWGYMRDATLPRKTVDGASLVGRVYSLGVQLYLDRSRGYARSDGGVGLSVGPKELKA